MRSRVEIDACTNETGSVRIRLPSAPIHHPVHIVVEWADPPAALGWPVGWFEETTGSIDDPTFVGPIQPTFEAREDGP